LIKVFRQLSVFPAQLIAAERLRQIIMPRNSPWWYIGQLTSQPGRGRQTSRRSRQLPAPALFSRFFGSFISSQFLLGILEATEANRRSFLNQLIPRIFGW